MNLTDELQKLQQLHEAGTVNDEEYARAKARLLDDQPLARSAGDSTALAAQEKQWAMLLHLSQLLGYVAPLAGWVVPVVIWQMKKEELPALDAHGKNAVNWMISALIYIVVCIPLFFVFIGIPLAIAVGVMCIVFPIIAAVKANDGDLWRYPLSITFFK